MGFRGVHGLGQRGVLEDRFQTQGASSQNERLAGRQSGEKALLHFAHPAVAPGDHAERIVAADGSDVLEVGAGHGFAGGAKAPVMHIDLAVGARRTEDAAAAGQIFDDRVEVFAREFEVRAGAAHEGPGFFEAPFALHRHAEQSLREDIERCGGDAQIVELSPARGFRRGGALEQIGQGERAEPALSDAVGTVSGAPEPLERARNAAGRADEQDLIDGLVIHAQFERTGADNGFQLAARQAVLRILAGGGVKRSVMDADPRGLAGQEMLQSHGEALRG
mgnify:CR=1 FL=1